MKNAAVAVNSLITRISSALHNGTPPIKRALTKPKMINASCVPRTKTYDAARGFPAAAMESTHW
jgi:hypothetical protein